jgi:hypothetical protein
MDIAFSFRLWLEGKEQEKEAIGPLHSMFRSLRGGVARAGRAVLNAVGDAPPRASGLSWDHVKWDGPEKWALDDMAPDAKDAIAEMGRQATWTAENALSRLEAMERGMPGRLAKDAFDVSHLGPLTKEIYVAPDLFMRPAIRAKKVRDLAIRRDRARRRGDKEEAAALDAQVKQEWQGLGQDLKDIAKFVPYGVMQGHILFYIGIVALLVGNIHLVHSLVLFKLLAKAVTLLVPCLTWLSKKGVPIASRVSHNLVGVYHAMRPTSFGNIGGNHGFDVPRPDWFPSKERAAGPEPEPEPAARPDPVEPALVW